VVHAADGIRFVALAADRHGLSEQVARYVADRAASVLWRREAASVLRALSAGDAEGAVERYFSAVGGRWDAESVTIAEVDESGATALAVESDRTVRLAHGPPKLARSSVPAVLPSEGVPRPGAGSLAPGRRRRGR
jgi:hypothetical protein